MEICTSLCDIKEEFKDESHPSSESDIDQHVTPITIDDIFKYYDFEPELEDKELEESIRNNKINMIKRVINQINRSLPSIVKQWPEATPLEIYIGFTMSCCDPEELVFNINDPKFRIKINDEYKYRLHLLNPKKSKNIQPPTPPPPASDSDVEEEEEIYESETFGYRATKRYPRKKPAPKKYPCPKDVDPEVWNKWSEIHQSSYLSGLSNPNQYLYRNLPPGEKQKNGSWSAEEKQLFLKRLEEMKKLYGDGTSRWGIFSQTIPGRVGYQCANFYRKLVLNGEIKDTDYYVDDEGKLRYRFPRKAKREKQASHSTKKKHEVVLSKYEKKALKNPLKGQIDSMTQEEIRVPAMSPSGYVLDYNTWTRLLKDKSEDPFTREHINRRQLVILTTKNINEYIGQIKNLNIK
ncbi:Myb-like DNA-binding domain containing protein [Histomonas meleagridis]|uniref:Myb-like DNA-binding domain containing protein n=1 Tax=Histomonas meleagridis TaxID=135588 RepID=UPI00355AC169|nr:Myb-like DNA-binding domain containing protein [Histomonas meleagridis]KAH0803922.1 Myb-like DNA-binding domain containing protein [Histomonas meleagridis]